jgi:hypothetical protein
VAFFSRKSHLSLLSKSLYVFQKCSRAALAVVAVLTVSVVEAAAPNGVTVAGEKLHDAPEGSP